MNANPSIIFKYFENILSTSRKGSNSSFKGISKSRFFHQGFTMHSAFHTEKEDGAGKESFEVMNKIKNTSTLRMTNRRYLGMVKYS